MSRSASSDPIVGIDLGTTNSLVAYCDERGPRILRDEHNRAMVPSLVRYQFDGASAVAVVGSEARDLASPGETVIRSVKRLMGRSVADAAADIPFLPYAVVEGPNRTARVRIAGPAGELIRTPQEVSAAVLGRLKQIAERDLGRPVSKAVITVPAYFDDAQRQATRDAGRLAGLEVVRIVNEPTGASLAYGLGSRETAVRTIAVYDLGGGTFDISILRLTPAAAAGETAFFQVLSTAGDTRLGGDDADMLLVQLFAADLAGRGLPPPDDDFKRALTAEAERVKIKLSEFDRAEAVIRLPDGGEYRRIVTRTEFERLLGPLIAQTMEACVRALTDAKIGTPVAPGTLDAVVLVGGSTRIPAVRAAVRSLLGVEPYTAIDPDQAVALGAAVQAGILSGTTKGTLLLDVIPLSLGIETAGGAAAKIVVRNSTVPTRAKEMFSTQIDGQTSIKIHIVQGEREMVEHCRSLGTFHLRGIPAMPAGVPQIEVEFLVDASGVLHVAAHERRSGRRAQLQVVPNYGLTRDEVDRIERESFTHAREDMARHRVVDLIVNCKLDLKWIGDRMAKFGDRLEPDAQVRLAGMVDQLRGMVASAEADWKSVDADEFHQLKERLDRESIRLQEISIAESLRSAGGR